MINSQYLSNAQSLLIEVEMINISIRAKTNTPYLRARYTLKGKRYEISTKETNRKLALKKAKEHIYRQLAEAEYPDTLGSKLFKEAYERKLLEGTGKNNKGYLEWFNSKLMNTPIGEIDKDMIWELKKKYKKEKPQCKKNQSLNRAFNALHGLLSDCEKWDWLERAPKNYKLKSDQEDTRRNISQEEANRLREASFQIGKPHIWEIIDFALNTGFRLGELKAMLKKNVCFETSRYLMPNQKNKKQNDPIDLNAKAMKIIERSISEEREEVFNFVNFRRYYEKVRDLSGIEGWDFHTTRHTAITNVASNSQNTAEIKTFSRHKSDVSLKRYVHLIDEQKRKEIAERATNWAK